jgi:hypothetical protein
MKRIIMIGFIIATTALVIGAAPDSYQVEAVYQELDGREIVGLTRSGNVVELDVLLKKTYYNSGRYSVSLWRVGDGIFRVNNGSLYLRIRNCYKYGPAKAILTITSSYGYNVGNVEFE